ncbi:forkhead box protein L2-like [Asparagus officinalis]|uniref:forkhead box protein L2-like n=1 Tax=Asparagus officinalis TaxID=4686 RepID=UPI00098E5E98|nr:forkhead box protein L2-like [Asparagus officinalis]
MNAARREVFGAIEKVKGLTEDEQKIGAALIAGSASKLDVFFNPPDERRARWRGARLSKLEPPPPPPPPSPPPPQPPLEARASSAASTAKPEPPLSPQPGNPSLSSIFAMAHALAAQTSISVPIGGDSSPGRSRVKGA